MRSIKAEIFRECLLKMNVYKIIEFYSEDIHLAHYCMRSTVVDAVSRCPHIRGPL